MCLSEAVDSHTRWTHCAPVFSHAEPGNLTPVRDSPAIPRLRSVNSYTNIRAATTARNLNKSLQNLNLNEEGRSCLCPSGTRYSNSLRRTSATERPAVQTELSLTTEPRMEPNHIHIPRAHSHTLQCLSSISAAQSVTSTLHPSPF